MDFSWEPEQVDSYDRALRFAREKLNSEVARRRRAHEFGRHEWNLCAEFGFQGLCISEQYGGMGLNTLSTARVVEALGRGCEDGGLVFSISAHLFACTKPAEEFGTEEAKAALLSPLCRGQMIGANAISETGAGSDVFALQTSAQKRGAEYVLNGTKNYVTNGPIADVFVVYAVTNPTHGYMGLSAFLVERDRPGVRVGNPYSKTGLMTSPMSAVYLEDCVVPERNLLGGEGQGSIIFRQSMHWERTCLFAAYVGQMDRQLEQCVEHAKTRKQFGKPIGKFQAVSHRIVGMKQRLEAARLLLYRACWLRDHGQEATLEVALAKLAVSEAAVESGLDAIRIHGGDGIIADTGVDSGLADALPATIFSGTSDMQRNLAAWSLGL